MDLWGRHFLGDSLRFGAASQLEGGRGGVEAEKLGGSDTLPETNSTSHWNIDSWKMKFPERWQSFFREGFLHKYKYISWLYIYIHIYSHIHIQSLWLTALWEIQNANERGCFWTSRISRFGSGRSCSYSFFLNNLATSIRVLSQAILQLYMLPWKYGTRKWCVWKGRSFQTFSF